jgi:hypothetical protein
MSEKMREREAARRNSRVPKHGWEAGDERLRGEGETRKDMKSCYYIFTAIKLNMEKEAASHSIGTRVADPWKFDPYLCLSDPYPDADPDPAIFVSDLQDINKKFYFLLLF